MSQTRIKKLSTKTVFGAVADVRKALGDKKEVMLYDLFGIASSWKAGEGNYGPFIAFKGDFTAINKVTGEEFASATCFLADDIAPLLQTALDSDKGSTVKFGLQIGVRPNERAGTGYEYVSKPIVPIVQSDAMAELRASMGAKALPEPKKQTETKKEPENKKK